jgi:hypothetical protein
VSRICRERKQVSELSSYLFTKSMWMFRRGLCFWPFWVAYYHQHCYHCNRQKTILNELQFWIHSLAEVVVPVNIIKKIFFLAIRAEYQLEPWQYRIDSVSLHTSLNCYVEGESISVFGVLVLLVNTDHSTPKNTLFPAMTEDQDLLWILGKIMRSCDSVFLAENQASRDCRFFPGSTLCNVW